MIQPVRVFGLPFLLVHDFWTVSSELLSPSILEGLVSFAACAAPEGAEAEVGAGADIPLLQSIKLVFGLVLKSIWINGAEDLLYKTVRT